jgi:hypothetical protein
MILVHGPQLITYMLEREPKSSALANPHQLQHAYAFLKGMSKDMIEEYLSLKNKMWFFTAGPGDALFLPAGIFFMEQTMTTPCVLELRVGLCLPEEPSIESLTRHLLSMAAVTKFRQELQAHPLPWKGLAPRTGTETEAGYGSSAPSIGLSLNSSSSSKAPPAQGAVTDEPARLSTAPPVVTVDGSDQSSGNGMTTKSEEDKQADAVAAVKELELWAAARAEAAD